MLVGIRICNYDVFDDDKCGLVMEDFLSLNDGKELSSPRLLNLTALIGRNGTGKSSFFDALSFIRKTITADVAIASTLNDRPGFSNLIIDKKTPAKFSLYFSLKPNGMPKYCYVGYDIEISVNIHGSPYISYEAASICSKEGDTYTKINILEFKNGSGKVLSSDVNGNQVFMEQEVCDEHSCALKIFGSIKSYQVLHELYREISRWFFCKFSNEKPSSYFADGNAPGGHKHLNSTGSNLSNVLNYMRVEDENRYDAIIDEIIERIPQMKHKSNLPSVLEESPNRLFLYLLLLRDSDPHSTIFIETPDKDLYHDMVDVLASEMRDFTFNNPYSQIVFTTHNPYIVETMSPREIWVFKRMEKGSIDDIEISCAGSDPIVDAMFKQGVGMGAIWYGGHLDE